MVRAGCEAGLQRRQTWVKLCNVFASRCLRYWGYILNMPLSPIEYAQAAICLIAIFLRSSQQRCGATVVLW